MNNSTKSPPRITLVKQPEDIVLKVFPVNPPRVAYYIYRGRSLLGGITNHVRGGRWTCWVDGEALPKTWATKREAADSVNAQIPFGPRMPKRA